MNKKWYVAFRLDDDGVVWYIQIVNEYGEIENSSRAFQKPTTKEDLLFCFMTAREDLTKYNQTVPAGCNITALKKIFSFDLEE